MTMAFKHVLALPRAEVTSTRGAVCDIAVGVCQDNVNAVLAELHKTLHASLFKGSFTDGAQTRVQIDWDLGASPTLSFRESADGLQRLAASIRQDTPEFADPARAETAVKGLRNLTLEVSVKDIRLKFSGGAGHFAPVEVGLECTLYSYVTLTNAGELRIVPFDVALKPFKAHVESVYENFIFALVDLYLPDLLIGKLTPALNAAISAHVLTLPKVEGVELGMLQLYFQNNFLVFAATMKGRREDPQAMTFAVVPTTGVFAYVSYDLANTIGANALVEMVGTWGGQKGGKWTVFAWSLGYDAWVGNLKISPPESSTNICRTRFDLSADLHLSARALMVKARLDGSLTEDTGVAFDLGLKFKQVQAETATSAALWDIQAVIGQESFLDLEADWHSNVPGLATLADWISNGLIGLLDLATVFKAKLTRTVARSLSLSRAVPLGPSSFVTAFTDPNVASTASGVLVTAGMTFKEGATAN